MPKIKVTLYATVSSHRLYTGPECLTFWTQDMTSVGYTTIYTQEVEIDLPDDLNPIEDQIRDLRTAQSEIRAEAEGKVRNIEASIQNLLALPAPGVK